MLFWLHSTHFIKRVKLSGSMWKLFSVYYHWRTENGSRIISFQFLFTKSVLENNFDIENNPSHVLFQWTMREHYNCHEECEIGFCPSSCGPEGFCYFSINENESESMQALIPESLGKQSLIINSKYIESSESKCFRPGKFSAFLPVPAYKSNYKYSRKQHTWNSSTTSIQTS